jgi:hypothetical protein
MNTIYIVQKELRAVWVPIIGFLALFAALAIIAQLASQRLLALFTILASALLIYSAFIAAERREDRNNGYRILLRMPIKSTEVAAGKLIVMYFLTVLSCVLMISISGIGALDPAYKAFMQGLILLFGCIWLIGIPLLYTGVCLLGYTRFLLIFRISIMALLVLVQIVLFFLLKSNEVGREMMTRLAGGIANAPWLVICGVMSVIYVLFVPFAAKMMRRHAAQSD